MRRGGPAAPFVGAPGASSDIPDLRERLPPGKLGGLPAEGVTRTSCPKRPLRVGRVSPGDTKAWTQEHPAPPTTDGAVHSTRCMMKTRSSRPDCTTGFREQSYARGTQLCRSAPQRWRHPESAEGQVSPLGTQLQALQPFLLQRFAVRLALLRCSG